MLGLSFETYSSIDISTSDVERFVILPFRVSSSCGINASGSLSPESQLWKGINR